MSATGPESESLSIGEMLDLLKAEFPDVTISKIRFLESQGLLDPERTASGYRKFYQADVERLRWILRQQRENFLPLKVIKGRLEAEGNAVFAETDAGPGPARGSGPGPDDQVAASAPTQKPPPDPAGAEARRRPEAGEAPPAEPRAESSSSPAGAVDEPGVTRASTFSRDELARASGLSPSELSQLERHGLVSGTSVGSQLCYDADSLEVARLAAAFSRHGVEPRHLRMYKNSAEREAGFYEQVVIPLLKQRNPAARQQAVETLTALSELGDGLRRTLLRQALRDIGQERKAPRRS